MTAVGGRVRQSRLVRACEEKLFLPALGVKGARWDIFPSVQAKTHVTKSNNGKDTSVAGTQGRARAKPVLYGFSCNIGFMLLFF